MSATIKDVAERAGVSSATASRALTDHPNVSARTRERVRQAALALGYEPNQIARSLRRGRSNLVGLIVSTIENVFFTEVARAVEQTAYRHGYHLIICNTEESPEREKLYLSLLERQNVTGIILAAAPGAGEHLRPLIDQGMPTVLINRRFAHLALPSITCDDVEASRACVARLIGEGRRRIAAITGITGISTTEDRKEGYRRALCEAGMGIDPALEISGGATLEGGYQVMMALLEQEERPDAVFVFNNLMTQGAVIAAQDRGLRWPDDIDIAGFGAFAFARLYRPPLTLIAQPTHEMGEQAMLMLMEQIEGNEEAAGDIVLPNRIIGREAWDEERSRLALDGSATAEDGGE